MNEIINGIITVLRENGINAEYGYRHDKANRPVNDGMAYVYPEKLEEGRLYIAIDIYSPFSNDLSECMQIAEQTARVISSSLNLQELTVSRLEYDRDAMGYVSRITCSTVYEDAGGVRLRFFGFKGKDELFVYADVFDIRFDTTFCPYPIFTMFGDVPEDVIYDSAKYTVTLKGARGGLGSLLSSYGLFSMSIDRHDGEFILRRCYVKDSDEPYGSTLTIVGYASGTTE